jgi:HEAT repeat protein
MLGDMDSSVRGSAAAALGDLDDRESIDRLLLLLDDTQQDPRVEAAIALSKLGDPRGLETLAEHLKHPELGPLVAEQLYRSASVDLVERLKGALKEWLVSPLTRVYCAGALCRLGDPEARDYLWRALHSPKAIVQGTAVEILMDLGNSWAKGALARFARSTAGADWREELQAVLDG